MTGVVAGIDAGGTKLQVRVERAHDGQVLADIVVPNTRWWQSSLASRADQVVARIREQLPNRTALIGLAVGAHGYDTPAQCAELHDALSTRIDVPSIVVVNDAELVVPASGRPSGIGVVAGTGSIAVGASATGERLWAGSGHRLLGNHGGALGLVGDAIREVLRDGASRPDDPLAPLLLGAAGLTEARDLAAALAADDPSPWTELAPVVFSAVEQGSVSAGRIVRDNGRKLAELVVDLASRGALAENVVAAGGVIAHQPLLRRHFVERLVEALPTTTVELLPVDPVAGAIALARETATPPHDTTNHHAVTRNRTHSDAVAERLSE